MGVVSLVANVVVLYLIKYYSKFTSPAYQTMLTIDASLDFVLCVFAVVGQPVGNGWTVANVLEKVSDGFFAGQWQALDSILLAGWFLCELYNIMWIAIQFIYRYSIVCLEQATEKSRILRRMAAVACVWWAVGTFFVTKFNFEEEPLGLRLLDEHHWNVADYSPMVTGGGIGTRMITWIGFWVTTVLGSTAVVVIFEVKFSRGFRASANIMSTTTMRLHAEFHRALLAMAITPLALCSVPILFFVVAACAGYDTGPEQVFLTMCTHAITIVSPLTRSSSCAATAMRSPAPCMSGARRSLNRVK